VSEIWSRFKVVLIAVAVGILCGLGLGWKLWVSGTGKVVERSAPMVIQSDGSLILGRDAGGSPKPAQMVPAGSVVERIIKVVVKPSPGPSGGGTAPTIGSGQHTDATTPAAPSTSPTLCPPVQVDLTLVRMPDKTRRVIASSPDGQVLPGASVDIPVDAVEEPRAIKWAAGLDYRINQWGNVKSLIAQRDIGFLRVGATIGKVTLNLPVGGTVTGTEIGAHVLIRF